MFTNGPPYILYVNYRKTADDAHPFCEYQYNAFIARSSLLLQTGEVLVRRKGK